MKYIQKGFFIVFFLTTLLGAQEQIPASEAAADSADKSITSAYIIEEILYDITGSTREHSIRVATGLKTGERFSSFQELEQYLCLFCNERQDDWDELLPDAEFQYNNYVHSSTQMTPFFLDTGRHPHIEFKP